MYVSRSGCMHRLSPLLGNIYLHYALDLGFAKAVRPRCRGEAHLVRFADDFVVLFEHEDDAQRFATVLPTRLTKFGLTLTEDKTRLIAFGRSTWQKAASQGHPAPRFDFLGFQHFGVPTRTGRWRLQRYPTAKSRRKFLHKVKGQLHRLMHAGPLVQQRYLIAALRGGHFGRYFGYPGCYPALRTIHYQVAYAWYQVLRRRSQRSAQTKTWYFSQRWFWLPGPTLRPRLTTAR